MNLWGWGKKHKVWQYISIFQASIVLDLHHANLMVRGLPIHQGFLIQPTHAVANPVEERSLLFLSTKYIFLCQKIARAKTRIQLKNGIGYSKMLHSPNQGRRGGARIFIEGSNSFSFFFWHVHAKVRVGDSNLWPPLHKAWFTADWATF